jgi:hypothetical protein
MPKTVEPEFKKQVRRDSLNIIAQVSFVDNKVDEVSGHVKSNSARNRRTISPDKVMADGSKLDGDYRMAG